MTAILVILILTILSLVGYANQVFLLVKILFLIFMLSVPFVFPGYFIYLWIEEDYLRPRKCNKLYRNLKGDMEDLNTDNFRELWFERVEKLRDLGCLKLFEKLKREGMDYLKHIGYYYVPDSKINQRYAEAQSKRGWIERIVGGMILFYFYLLLMILPIIIIFFIIGMFIWWILSDPIKNFVMFCICFSPIIVLSLIIILSEKIGRRR